MEWNNSGARHSLGHSPLSCFQRVEVGSTPSPTPTTAPSTIATVVKVKIVFEP